MKALQVMHRAPSNEFVFQTSEILAVPWTLLLEICVTLSEPDICSRLSIFLIELNILVSGKINGTEIMI